LNGKSRAGLVPAVHWYGFNNDGWLSVSSFNPLSIPLSYPV
jgi:hypothetical protein